MSNLCYIYSTMFLNVSKVKYGNKVYAYLRILESYCSRGKIKKRLIANLGQLALIDKDSLYRLGSSLIEYSIKFYPSSHLRHPNLLKYSETV